MPVHKLAFNSGFAALLVADSIALLLRFGWLVWLSISDGLSTFKRHSALPLNSESRTFLSLGNLCFARWSKKESPFYNFGPMAISDVVQQLDNEIARLQKARQALTTSASSSMNHRSGPQQMSAAARARISAAQKKRWAAVRAQKKK